MYRTMKTTVKNREIASAGIHSYSTITTAEHNNIFVETTSSSSISYFVKGVCGVCEKPCNCTICISCNKPIRACKKHQREIFNDHKAECFPVLFHSRGNNHKSLIVTRDFEPGEIILKETPLVSAPYLMLGESPVPVCLSCYQIVMNGNSCSRCKWPVCDSRCEKVLTSYLMKIRNRRTNKIHADAECKIFVARKVEPILEDGNGYITALRSILLQGEGTKKSIKLQRLKQHLKPNWSESSNDELFERQRAFIVDTCGIALTPELQDELKFITYVLKSKVFFIDDRKESQLVSKKLSLYGYSSLLAHSCVPNSYWVMDGKSEISVIASIQIKAGDIIRYNMCVNSFEGTHGRLRLLNKYCGISCGCYMCKDPTENGNNFSSVKCMSLLSLRPCMGYLLALDPRDEKSNWECTVCGYIRDYIYIDNIVNKIVRPQQEKLLMEEYSYSNIRRMEQFIVKTAETRLHPNHHLIFRIQYELLHRMYCLHFSGSIDFEDCQLSINKYVSLGKVCQLVFNSILPGVNRYRGRVIYYLQHGLILFYLRNWMENPNPTEKQTKELRDLANEIKADRKEVMEMLSFESNGTEEFIFHNRMLENNYLNMNIPPQQLIRKLILG